MDKWKKKHFDHSSRSAVLLRVYSHLQQTVIKKQLETNAKSSPFTIHSASLDNQ